MKNFNLFVYTVFIINIFFIEKTNQSCDICGANEFAVIDFEQSANSANEDVSSSESDNLNSDISNCQDYENNSDRQIPYESSDSVLLHNIEAHFEYVNKLTEKEKKLDDAIKEVINILNIVNDKNSPLNNQIKNLLQKLLNCSEQNLNSVFGKKVMEFIKLQHKGSLILQQRRWNNSLI